MGLCEDCSLRDSVYTIHTDDGSIGLCEPCHEDREGENEDD